MAAALGDDAVLCSGVDGELPFQDKQFDAVVVAHDPAQVRAALGEAGLEVREWYVCGAPDGAEVVLDRLYVLAGNPRAAPPAAAGRPRARLRQRGA